MGLFPRTSRESSLQEEQIQKAKLLIAEAKEAFAHSPEKAQKILQKQAKPLYKALGFQGQVHGELKQR